ncbi:hypothetical protein IMZ48_03300, partial [Candidatus Bathyarchaeota archaeon]|nr:hypothetical protein [Candidatus Bathyarchaeota archaeon]
MLVDETTVQGNYYMPEVIRCADGSYCCNNNPTCCGTNSGFMLDGEGNIIGGTSTSSSSSSPSSTETSTTKTPSAEAPSTQNDAGPDSTA